MQQIKLQLRSSTKKASVMTLAAQQQLGDILSKARGLGCFGARV